MLIEKRIFFNTILHRNGMQEVQIHCGMKIKKSLALLKFTSLEQVYVPTLISLTIIMLSWQMLLAHQTTQNQKHASQTGHFTRPGLSDSILIHPVVPP